jgi:hypothetical protein
VYSPLRPKTKSSLTYQFQPQNPASVSTHKDRLSNLPSPLRVCSESYLGATIASPWGFIGGKPLLISLLITRDRELASIDAGYRVGRGGGRGEEEERKGEEEGVEGKRRGHTYIELMRLD